MGIFIFVAATFLPAIFILGSAISLLIKSARQVNKKSKSPRYMLVAIIGIILCINVFLWHTVPYYMYVFYENGRTNGIILLFCPTLQALIASTPAVLLSAVLYVLSWHLNKSVR